MVLKPSDTEEQTMNTLNPTGLKVLACTMAAVAVTTVMSWSFVTSTSVARWTGESASALAVAAAENTASRFAATGRAVLLD